MQREKVKASPEGSQQPELWRLPKVKAITGKSKAAIYSDKSFPKPVKLSARAVGWLSTEIHAWIEERVRLSRLAA